MKERNFIQWKFDNDAILSCTDLKDQFYKEEIIRNVVAKKKEGFKLKYIKRVYLKNLTYIEHGYFLATLMGVEQHITLTDMKHENTKDGVKKWARELLNIEEELKWTQKSLPL